MDQRQINDLCVAAFASLSRAIVTDLNFHYPAKTIRKGGHVTTYFASNQQASWTSEIACEMTR